EVALVALVFLGVPYTMQVGGHVAIDSLTSRLPAAWRHYVEAVALAMTLPFVVWLTVASVGVAVDSFQSGEAKYGVVQAPVWPARVAIAVGSALLAAEIAITIGRLLTGRREQPDSHSTELL
ncbi:MAG TPA: TRAP transporter small permease, partial [Acidimicrobiia bacterium]|nr:TRAP transporter small permease [Acidimicrobiia bacterium]